MGRRRKTPGGTPPGAVAGDTGAAGPSPTGGTLGGPPGVDPSSITRDALAGGPSYDIGFGAPIPDDMVSDAYGIEQVRERLVGQIEAALSAQASAIGGLAGQCRSQIHDWIVQRVADVADAQDLAIAPVERWISGIAAQAIEIARGVGCRVDAAVAASQPSIACSDVLYASTHGEQCLTRPLPSSPDPGTVPLVSGSAGGTSPVRPPSAITQSGALGGGSGSRPGGGGSSTVPSGQVSDALVSQQLQRPVPTDDTLPSGDDAPITDPSVAVQCASGSTYIDARGVTQACTLGTGAAPCNCPKCKPGLGAQQGECYYRYTDCAAGSAGSPVAADLPPAAQSFIAARGLSRDDAATLAQLVIDPALRPPLEQSHRAYYDFRACQCYTLAPGESPRSAQDMLLAAGSGPGCVASIIQDICPPRTEAPPKPPRKKIKRPSLDLKTGNYCADLDKLKSDAFDDSGLTIADALGLEDSEGNPTSPFSLERNTVGNTVVDTILQSVIFPALRGVVDFVQTIIPTGQCVSPAGLAYQASRILVGLAAQYIGPGAAEVSLPVTYASRHLCPTAIPSQDQAIEAWLADQISTSTRDCWITSNNQLLDPYLTLAESRRSRFNPAELLALCRRDHIPESDAKKLLRELGYTLDTDWDHVQQLGEQVPTMSEILMMMVRDADDQDIVSRFRLDDQFGDKFASQLRTWAKQQGITEQHARYVWRAHWTIPPPTALYQMSHRLSRLPPGDPSSVTDEDIRTALVQQDIAPYWIDKYLAIAHPPLGRIDIRRAFRLGAIKRDDLPELYMQLGYTDDAAAILTEYTVRDARRQWRNSPATRRYASGEITSDALRDELQRDGADEQSVQLALEHGRSLLVSQTRKRCLAALRRRINQGDLDYQDAVSAVIDQGLDLDQATMIVTGWQCERDSRDKHATISMLTQWLDDGTITPDIYMERLSRLGYAPGDAMAILRHAQRTLTDRQVKIAEARGKKDQASRDKEQRRQAAESRKIKSELDKMNKGLIAARKARERRAAIMLRAAKILADHAGISAVGASERLRLALDRIRADYGLSIDPAVKAVTLGVESWDPDSGRTPEESIDSFAFAESADLSSASLDP